MTARVLHLVRADPPVLLPPRLSAGSAQLDVLRALQSLDVVEHHVMSSILIPRDSHVLEALMEAQTALEDAFLRLERRATPAEPWWRRLLRYFEW